MKQIYKKYQLERLIRENKEIDNLQEGLYGSTKGFFKGIGGALKNSWKHMMESKRLGSDIEDVKDAVEALNSMRSIIGRKRNKKALGELRMLLNDLYKAYNGQTNDNFNGSAYADNPVYITNNDWKPNPNPTQVPSNSTQTTPNHPQVSPDTEKPQQAEPIMNGEKIEDEEELSERVEDIYKALNVLGLKGNEIKTKKDILKVIEEDPSISDQDIIKQFLKKM